MIPEVQCKILRKNEAKLVKKEFGRAIVCRLYGRIAGSSEVPRAV